jgi:hypothetical protein
MEMIRFAIQICTWFLMGLMFVRVEQLGSRLYCLARRGRRRIAMRLLLANPILNSYFLFTLIMIGLYVRTNNVFGAQGRNWLPFILPIFLTGLVYAPRALTLCNSRRVLTWSLTSCLALFVAAGAYCAPRNILERYYAPGQAEPMIAQPLALDPVAMNQMTWKGHAGDGLGDDPYLVFQLPKTEYVYCVRIRFVLNNTDHKRCLFQSYWMQNHRTTFTGPDCTTLYGLRPEAHEQLLTIWINQPIDLFRLDPDTRPCHFELKEMTAMIKPQDVTAAAAVSSPGS